MAPNLMLIAKKTCNPLSWFLSTQSQYNPQNYHYQMAPVTGIYWSRSPNNRYLIAIKPTGNKNIDNIFAAPKRCKNSLPRPSEQLSRPESQASTVTWGSTKSATSSTKSVLFTTENRGDITYSTRNKHDRMLLSKKDHFKLFEKEKINFNHVTREDCCGGFRRLAKPLKVQYHRILERWMFEAEIEERTIRIDMCASENCESYRHDYCEWQCAKACGSSKCGTMVEREMFALDDGETWVITGDLKNRKFRGETRWWFIVERPDIDLRDCGLFCRTKWEGLRRMRAGEAYRRRRGLLGMMRGSPRCMAEGDHLHERVVSYLAADKPSYGTMLDLKMESGSDEDVGPDDYVGLDKGVGLEGGVGYNEAWLHWVDGLKEMS